MPADQRQLEVTAANAEAVRSLDGTVDDYLRFGRDTGAHLKAALEADPEMVMGHCLKGYFFHLMGNAALTPRAARSLEAAEAGAAEATPRERHHVAALAAWCAGDLGRATALWEDILLGHPTDILALKLAHYTHFYLGDCQQMRDSAARVLPAWDESVPGYGYVLGVHAFGLEECGDYGAAEDSGRRAVEINPRDIWAVHAVAHVMEMQGRHRDGIDWIGRLEPHWQGFNNFAYHVWWHRALFHLERGENDEVLALYDEHVRADETDDYLDISNGAALLWRLELGGLDVGERWAELADRSEARVDDHLLVFADAHFLMSLAGGERRQAVAEMLSSMRRYAAGHETTEAPILAEVGIPLCEALSAYRDGAYDEAIELLLPIRYQLWRIGGSHAQRDVFAQTLIEATLRQGRFELARALLAERCALKPTSALTWSAAARAWEGLGRAEAAAEARARVEALRAA